MAGFFLRMMWFSFASTVLAYASYTVLGSSISVSAMDSRKPVLIHDELSPGTHQLSGIITLPSDCDQLSLDTSEPRTHVYQLTFNTWHDPSVKCTPDVSPRIFHAILFGPATGISFVATLDQRTLPIVVYPSLVSTVHL